MADTTASYGASASGAGNKLEDCIRQATEALHARQQADGHWVFELEADCTIPALYVLLQHFLGEGIDTRLDSKIAVYLRRIQGAHGGWPLFRAAGARVSAAMGSTWVP